MQPWLYFTSMLYKIQCTCVATTKDGTGKSVVGRPGMVDEIKQFFLLPHVVHGEGEFCHGAEMSTGVHQRRTEVGVEGVFPADAHRGVEDLLHLNDLVLDPGLSTPLLLDRDENHGSKAGSQQNSQDHPHAGGRYCQAGAPIKVVQAMKPYYGGRTQYKPNNTDLDESKLKGLASK